MRRVHHAAWPQDDKHWRVQWLGAIEKGYVPSEYLINVLIATHGEASNRQESTKIIQVGLGAMPDLEIGSVWQNGYKQYIAGDEHRDFTISMSDGALKQIDARFQISHDISARRYLIPPNAYKIGAEMLGSQCLVTVPLSNTPSLIIPCTEIARGWFFRSTNITLKLTNSAPTDTFSSIYDPDQSGIAQNGGWRVHLRSTTQNSDAAIAAMLACDQLARDRVRLILNSIVKGSVERRPVFLAARPPVNGTHKIRVRGKWIRSGGVDRFLVFSLVEIPFPAHAGPIYFSREGAREGKTSVIHNFDLVPDAAAKPSSCGTPSLRHYAEPSLKKRPTHAKFEPPSFIGADDILNVQTPLGRHVELGLTTEPGAILDEHSTGEGDYSEEGPRPLRYVSGNELIERVRHRESLPPGFEVFKAVMEVVDGSDSFAAELVDDFEFANALTGGECCEFPERVKNKYIRWARINLSARRFMVYRIRAPRIIAFTIEIESKPKENYTLAVVATRSGRQPSETDIFSLIEECATRRGVWPKKIDALVIKKLKHTRKSVDDFAVAIMQAILDLQPVTDEEQVDGLVTDHQYKQRS